MKKQLTNSSKSSQKNEKTIKVQLPEKMRLTLADINFLQGTVADMVRQVEKHDKKEDYEDFLVYITSLEEKFTYILKHSYETTDK